MGGKRFGIKQLRLLRNHTPHAVLYAVTICFLLRKTRCIRVLMAGRVFVGVSHKDVSDARSSSSPAGKAISSLEKIDLIDRRAEEAMDED